MSTITIPPPADLRADIRARSAELRALRRLLRLAEAAEAARHALEVRRPPTGAPDRREGAAHA